MAERLLGALEVLGAEHALVFYGHDGLDELTTTTTSTVFELRDGEVIGQPSHEQAGLELACATIDDGRAAAALDAFVRTSVAARDDDGA